MLDRYEGPEFKLELERLPAYRFVIEAGDVFEEIKKLVDSREARFDAETSRKYKNLSDIAKHVIALIKEYEKNREPFTIPNLYVDDYKRAKAQALRIRQADYLRDKIKREREDLTIEQEQLKNDIEETAELVATLEDGMRHEVNTKKDRYESERSALKQDLQDYEAEIEEPEGNDDVFVGCFGSLEQKHEARRQQRLTDRIAEISLQRKNLKTEQDQLQAGDDRYEEINSSLAELKKQQLLLESEKQRPPRRIGLFSACFPTLSHNAAVHRKAGMEAKLEVSKQRLADLNEKLDALSRRNDPLLAKNERFLRMLERRKIEVDTALSQPFNEVALSKRMQQEEFKLNKSLALRQMDIDREADLYYGKYKPLHIFEMLRLYLLLIDCVQALKQVPLELQKQVDEMHESAKLIRDGSGKLNHRDLYTLQSKADQLPAEKAQFLYAAFEEKGIDGREFTSDEKELRASVFLRTFSVRDVGQYPEAALFRRITTKASTTLDMDKGKEEADASEGVKETPAFAAGIGQ